MNEGAVRPMVCCGIIERGDGQVLICRRPASERDEPHWEFLTTVKRHGESPETAVRRAAANGLALEVQITVGQPPFEADFEGRPAVFRYFQAAALTGDVRIGPPYAEARWVARGQLCEYDFAHPHQQVVAWYAR